MPSGAPRGLSHLQQLGLGSRMVAGMLGAIAATAVAAGLPAYLLIHAELDRQAWSRVEQAAATSEALVQAEQDRLGDLALLAANRPTLRALIEAGRWADLESYLLAFKASADLDALAVLAPSGAAMAGDEAARSLFPLPGDAGAAIARQTDLGIALAGWAPISGSVRSAPIGSILVARSFDEGHLTALKTQTGLDYSLVVGGLRRATTMEAGSGERVADPGRAMIRVGGAPYDSVMVSLGDPVQDILLEVALPMETILVEERRALAVLGVSTVAVAAAVGILGLLLSRTVSRPLDRLTESAHRITRGDLETPVPIPPGPPEIAVLAASLEESRTKTRHTLEILSRQKAWSETLLQSIVEGIVTLDADGDITSFSTGAERLTGWEASEAVGRSANSVFRSPDHVSFLDQLPRPGDRRAVKVLHQAGQMLTLSITDAPMRPPAESEAHLALVLRDVSEDEAVRQLRSYFLANISHEFRTPLSAIRASVDLLLEDLNALSREEIGGLLHSIFLSVTGLQTLIDNLLESLSIESGRFTIRRVATDLGQVIADAVRVMRPLLDRREQPLEVVVPASVPPVWIDPMRVAQVIVNLLSNASKYSPVRRPITLEAQVAGETVTVRVSDRGGGIAPADRENLFRRFVRLERSDPGQYGVGLGLSVVKAIVEEHGGRVGVADRPGGGSIFWFSLPLQETSG